MSHPPNDDYYVASPDEIRARFADPKIRIDFVQKVCGIFAGQLMFTFFFIFLTATNDELRTTLSKHMELLIISIVITFIISIVFACCEGPRRQVPLNYILLGIFTICETIMMCFFTMHFQSRVLLYAVGITAVICLLATLVACCSGWDFTTDGCICFLLIMGIVMMIFGLVMMFIPHTPIVTMIFSGMGAGIFSLYLIFEIQLMLGGTHQNSISPEDYCFAALSIYMDVILIFQYVLLFMDECCDT